MSGQLNAAVTAVAERAAEMMWEEQGASFTREAAAEAARIAAEEERAAEECVESLRELAAEETLQVMAGILAK